MIERLPAKEESENAGYGLRDETLRKLRELRELRETLKVGGDIGIGKIEACKTIGIDPKTVKKYEACPVPALGQSRILGISERQRSYPVIVPLDWSPSRGAFLIRSKTMSRIQTFTFRIDDTERNMLIHLSNTLQRTQSDAVRLLIREAVKELGHSKPRSSEVGKGQNERN